LLFEGQSKPDFKPKSKSSWSASQYCPYLNNIILQSIRKYVSAQFRIASSASGMAALAVNIMSLEKALFPEMTEDYFNRKAIFSAFGFG
jgi:diphosphomevalonate decarboxylase